MSEEQIKEEKKCCCKCTFIIALVALVLSVASLAVSLMNSNFAGANKKVVISKQYDKGQNFEKAQEKEKPIVVFFYTDWCGFCQKFAPTFAKVVKSKEIKKNFAIAYVNCENPDNHELMAKYEVHGFPTVFVVNGEEKTQLDNHKFFGDEAVEKVKEEILEAVKLDD